MEKNTAFYKARKNILEVKLITLLRDLQIILVTLTILIVHQWSVVSFHVVSVVVVDHDRTSKGAGRWLIMKALSNIFTHLLTV